MALVTCKECTHEISNKARFCTHCGAPRSAKSKRSTFGIVAILLSLFLIVKLAGQGPPPTDGQTASQVSIPATSSSSDQQQFDSLLANVTGGKSEAPTATAPQAGHQTDQLSPRTGTPFPVVQNSPDLKCNPWTPCADAEFQDLGRDTERQWYYMPEEARQRCQYQTKLSKLLDCMADEQVHWYAVHPGIRPPWADK